MHNNIMPLKRLSVLISIILSLSSAVNTSSEELLLAKEEQPQNNNDNGGEVIDTIIISSEEELAHSSVVTANNPQQQQQQHDSIQETTSTTPHEPPSHFEISAHIQTNLHTGLSYFLPLHNNNEPTSTSSCSFAHIPFLECGAIGSTTAIVPLVSGVFRHVPVVMSGSAMMEEEKLSRGGLEFLEEMGSKDIIVNDAAAATATRNDAFFDNEGEDTSNGNYRDTNHNGPKRPSPPTYVVALSPLEITVGGNGNETQQFNAGDVIFFEDTWLGIWDDDDEKLLENDVVEKVQGYTMRASSESREDMNVIMLTIPPALHRQWKHRFERQQQKQQQQQLELQTQESERNNNNSSNNMAQDKVSSNKSSNKTPWWKLSSRVIKKQQPIDNLPKPCSLESDPAFAHPSVSVPTTLSHHFSQHFTNLLRQFHHQPVHLSSSLSYDGYDVILPLLVQTAAATIGATTAFAGVIHLLRTVNPTVAIGFGAACVIGFGTWGIVWLGEELLDEWEMWRERRRLERRMK